MKNPRRKREAPPPAASEPVSAEVPMVSLPAMCTFRETADLKAQLIAISAAANVKLNVAPVQRVDTAGMQVLCAFIRDRQNEKLGFQWEGNSAALNEAGRLLGLTSMLQLPTT